MPPADTDAVSPSIPVEVPQSHAECGVHDGIFSDFTLSSQRVLVVLLVALCVAGCTRSLDLRESQERLERNPELWIAQGLLEDAQYRTFAGADISRGMEVMLGTAPCQTSQTCYSCYQCHGISGSGSSLANFPRLTRQSYEYLFKSLRDFQSERRINATMQEVADGLTEQQMRDVAAYYAGQAPGWPAAATPAPVHSDSVRGMLELGRSIAQQGIPEAGIQACGSCHGIEGPAVLPLYPYLSGQDSEYLQTQLKAFRSGQRLGSLNIMEFIARQLSEEQMHAVAIFYGSLQAPRNLPTGDVAHIYYRASEQYRADLRLD